MRLGLSLSVLHAATSCESILPESNEYKIIETVWTGPSLAGARVLGLAGRRVRRGSDRATEGGRDTAGWSGAEAQAWIEQYRLMYADDPLASVTHTHVRACALDAQALSCSQVTARSTFSRPVNFTCIDRRRAFDQPNDVRNPLSIRSNVVNS